MCLVDLEKVYDRVPRDLMWECLGEYGVDDELVRAIASLYKSCKACVRANGVKSRSFTVGTGLRQGCVLSPLLFIIFMDRIVKRSRGAECVKIGDVKVARLLFADDLVILASSQADIQSALDRFAAECEASSMKISVAKSEVMVVARSPTDCVLHVSGAQLRQVQEFKYLGIVFTSDGRQEREIDHRINQASAVARELGRMVVSNVKLSREAKLAVFRSLFNPHLWSAILDFDRKDPIASTSGRNEISKEDRWCHPDGPYQEHRYPTGPRSRAATPLSGKDTT